jgi:N-methylhydantoinase A
MRDRSLRVAVDVGGTFTDVILGDSAGDRLVAVKVLTTPRNRAEGVTAGIQAVLDTAGAEQSRLREIVHGSTTGTNALINRTGARVGLLTTAGFRDVLEIGRIMRPAAGLYDFSVDLPLPLVPRRLRLEARERVGADGCVLVPLDEDSVRSAAQAFAAAGVEAIAVSYLFSFLHPQHEIRSAQILAEYLPGVHISLSCEVAPEYREYERTSTTVINAYLSPAISDYLSRLEQRVASQFGAVRLSIIQANGGSTSVDTACRLPVTTVNSGPAGGVVAAAFYGQRHAREHIVSVDMGGTSFDIGLIEHGKSKVTTEGTFQDLPVRIPIIDLHTIGAGGGSLAWCDPAGAINVGPHSAGADPGPACYGRGGTQPTVTDANLVLGRLNPDYFNGGRMPLDATAARRAVADLAWQLSLGVEEAAISIVKVVNANMVKGIASVTIERGIDVREFSLFSFGGAGGAHAVDLARELNMIEAIIPPMAGTFSALGLLASECRHDYVVALGGVPTDAADPATLERHFRKMEVAGRKDLQAQGFSAGRISLVRHADMKVIGQTYELSTTLRGGDPIDAATLDALTKDFANLYRERYAFFFEGEKIELVNLRVSAHGRNDPVRLVERPLGGPDSMPALKCRRLVYFETAGFLETGIYERDLMQPGMVIEGPAVIEEATSAIVVPPGTRAGVLRDLGLQIRLKK